MSNEGISIRNFTIQAQFAKGRGGHDSCSDEDSCASGSGGEQKEYDDALIREIVTRCLDAIETEMEWKNER